MMIKKTPTILVATLLAWPLVSQAIPYVGAIFFLLAGVLIIFLLMYFRGISDAMEFWRTDLGKLLLLMNITFFYGMLISIQAVTLPIIKDSVRGVVYICVWLAIVQVEYYFKNNYLKNIVRYYSKAILFASFWFAALGLMKYGMGLNGEYWRFLEVDPVLYPWGTSLVGDYNFYSLTLFVGGFIILRHWSTSVSSLHALWYGAMFALVYSAAWLAGSRRFWILSPILIPAYLMCVSIHFKKLNINLRWVELVAGIFLAFSLMYICKFLWAPTCVNAANRNECVAYEIRMGQRVEKLVGVGKLDAISSRTDRWVYAIEIGDIREKLVGNGFVYRKEFGCRYDGCNSDDYPHAPILSGLLYGGVFAAIVTAALMIYALFIAYKIIKAGVFHLDLAFGLIVTTAYIMISGDTLFSTPVFFSMLIISKCALLSRENRISHAKI